MQSIVSRYEDLRDGDSAGLVGAQRRDGQLNNADKNPFAGKFNEHVKNQERLQPSSGSPQRDSAMKAEDLDEIVMTQGQAGKPNQAFKNAPTPGAFDSRRESTSGPGAYPRKLKGREQEEAMRDLLSKRQQQIVQEQVQAHLNSMEVEVKGMASHDFENKVKQITERIFDDLK